MPYMEHKVIGSVREKKWPIILSCQTINERLTWWKLYISKVSFRRVMFIYQVLCAHSGARKTGCSVGVFRNDSNSFLLSFLYTYQGQFSPKWTQRGVARRHPLGQTLRASWWHFPSPSGTRGLTVTLISILTTKHQIFALISVPDWCLKQNSLSDFLCNGAISDSVCIQPLLDEE